MSIVLVESQPDEAWADIGWTNPYWLGPNSLREYEHAVTAGFGGAIVDRLTPVT